MTKPATAVPIGRLVLLGLERKGKEEEGQYTSGPNSSAAAPTASDLNPSDMIPTKGGGEFVGGEAKGLSRYWCGGRPPKKKVHL